MSLRERFAGMFKEPGITPEEFNAQKRELPPDYSDEQLLQLVEEFGRFEGSQHRTLPVDQMQRHNKLLKNIKSQLVGLKIIGPETFAMRKDIASYLTEKGVNPKFADEVASSIYYEDAQSKLNSQKN